MQSHAPKSRAFISYATADKVFVQWLADSLAALNVRLWVDYAEIRVGDSIVERINEGLGRADTLVVVLSRASVQSRWVKQELNSAFFQSVSTKQLRILPVLMEYCE